MVLITHCLACAGCTRLWAEPCYTSLGMQLNWTFLMLHDNTSGKDNTVFKGIKENFIDLNDKKGGKKEGGSQNFGCMYARGGGGVIQMRTVCNRGDGGV